MNLLIIVGFLYEGFSILDFVSFIFGIIGIVFLGYLGGRFFLRGVFFVDFGEDLYVFSVELRVYSWIL